MKQCARCWGPINIDRRDCYCPDCRRDTNRAYKPWIENGRQGSILPPYTGPKRGPEPVRKPRVTGYGKVSTQVTEQVAIYDASGPRRGQHELRVSPRKRQEILDSQDGQCALCRKEISIYKKDRGAAGHLDHDHLPPYAVRGYLCGKCNVGLGKFQDDPDLLQAASDYVRRFRDTGSQEETA